MVKSKESPIEQAKKAADEFEQSVKDLTDFKPAKSQGHQDLGMSQNEIAKSKDIYLKPLRSIPDGKEFDEKYREEYEFESQYVSFIAEHKEIIGEKIEVWTKKFKGKAAEYWEVPSGKVVWGPRYLAERIAGCTYRRLKTEDKPVSNEGYGTMTGALIVDAEVARLEATPVNKGKKSIFMGA